MTRIWQRLAVAAALLGASACTDGFGPEYGTGLIYDVNFNSGASGWIAGFTDYQAGLDTIYEFESGIRRLPAPLDTARQAFMLSSVNRSDDMFQYIRTQVANLEPGAHYDIRFRVQLASNAGQGCIGAGGAPGESVWLKAGAATTEPTPVVTDGDVRLSVDKGEQAAEGDRALILGNMATSSQDCHAAPYQLKDFDSAPRALRARADSAGRIWLFVGTESGFEARTRVYVSRVRAELRRVAGP